MNAKTDYQAVLREPGAKEVGPGLVKTGPRAFVVDMSKAAPAYLKAIGESLSLLNMELVRVLITRDLENLAEGDSGRIDINIRKFPGWEKYSDVELQKLEPAEITNVDRNKKLMGVPEAMAKLNAYRIKLAAKATGKLEL